jgi:iron-sulfur cluster repair protein YtfE (RIC family)
MNCGLETSIPDWVIEYPETSPVFDELRLDSSCGGKSLEYVCEHLGIDPSNALARLTRVVDASGNQ